WGRTIARFAVYGIGLLSISLGTVLQTESGLGVASLTCFATFAARALGTTLGAMIFLTYILYVSAQIIILHGHFHLRILLETVFAFGMGYFVDMIANLVQINLSNILAQTICMLGALVVTAFGVTLMVGMDVVPNAPDGLVQVISGTLKKPFGNIKVVFDSSHVLVSIIGSLVLFGDIEGFGLTTVVSALLLGRIINVMESLVGDHAKEMVFGRCSYTS
ncbi:YitT family protein, partial [Alkalibaculum bacchi]|uniref:YczE/YyaS/YitT family protein n=1 Tax=Alkalibaculum bacchi TaxID=645887 RepID=UPI0026F070AF